ncbi:DUF397 domain-containing protein [Streptomyces zhihengii]
MTSHIEDASTLRATWWKSSASGTQSDCVEFARVAEQTAAIRDSKRPTGPALLVGHSAVGAMVDALKSGAL